MIREKKMEFDRKDTWDSTIFYKIFEKNGDKYFKLLCYTERLSVGKGYLTFNYAILEDKPGYEKKLTDFNEWDPSRTFVEMREDCMGWMREAEPQFVFNLANKYIKGDGNGCERFRPFIDDEIDIPCGYYYC